MILLQIRWYHPDGKFHFVYSIPAFHCHLDGYLCIQCCTNYISQWAFCPESWSENKNVRNQKHLICLKVRLFVFIKIYPGPVLNFDPSGQHFIPQKHPSPWIFTPSLPPLPAFHKWTVLSLFLEFCFCLFLLLALCPPLLPSFGDDRFWSRQGAYELLPQDSSFEGQGLSWEREENLLCRL